jgi:hypothetical protein
MFQFIYLSVLLSRKVSHHEKNNYSYVARWGSACGIPFDSKAYLEKHRQFDWMDGLLHDRQTQPWTSFKADEDK